MKSSPSYSTDIIKQIQSANRITCYYMLIEKAARMLNQPSPFQLETVWILLNRALELEGDSWNIDYYTSIPDFGKAGTIGEKKIFFIHKILTSGLRIRKSIVELMNMYIFIIDAEKLRAKISIPLPSRKELHDLVIPDFKY